MVNLTCVVSGTNAVPKEIFWYHEGKVSTSYGNKNGNPEIRLTVCRLVAVNAVVAGLGKKQSF